MKKLTFTVSFILLISLYVIIILFLIIVKINSDKNYYALLKSINTLSRDNKTIPLLYKTNSGLFIAENNFRIYLNTEDSNYKRQFLQNIDTSIACLEEIKNSEDSLDISKTLLKLKQGVQLADAIVKLKKFADSFSNKLYYVTSANNHPIKAEKIDKNILRKYINERKDYVAVHTDTLKTVSEKKSFIKKLGSLFSKKDRTKYELVKGDSSLNINNNKKTDSIADRNSYEVNDLSKQIQQFYERSLNKELKVREDLNKAERKIAENNLSIIEDINTVIKIVLQNKLQRKQQTDAEVVSNIIKSRNSMRFFSGVLLFAILAIIVILILRITGRSRKQQQETLKALTQKLMMERKLLQSQMDPHFVFNALTSIQSFILRNDTKKAIAYLSKFSKLMRQILLHSKADKILLDDEIATLENYIIIQRLKLQDHFDYVIESNNLLNNQIFIPPMLIQPFVENAIEHGFKFLKERRGRLVISFKEDEDSGCIVCKVEDNGIGIEQSKQQKRKESGHNSIAILIAGERIYKMRTAKHSTSTSSKDIEIIDKSKIDPNQTGTLVIIRIPII